MLFRDNLKISFSGLSTHKSRSALTILGIVIGVTSIILVMSLGKSAESLIIGQVQGLGTSNIVIIPGRQPNNPSGFGGTIINDSLKQKDLEDLQKKSNVPDAIRVVPIIFGPIAASFGSELYNTMVLGGSEEILNTYRLSISRGDFFEKEDVAGRSEVIVIGPKVAQKLFGLSDPIGQKIKVKGKNFKVIGVLAPKGQSPFVNFDEVILTPYTTAQQYILGIRYIQRIVVESKTTEDMAAVTKDIKNVLRNNHNIDDPDKDDFFIQTQADLVNTLSTVTDVLTILLTSVAAISLLVGGIGIMNIMFVSVTERTREIGLRKAIGATNKNILIQFLTEAIILTFTGGLVGIFLGTSLSFVTTFLVSRIYEINFPFEYSVIGLILGVTVSTATGLIFGIFPARKAAQKSPIEALRYE